MDVDAGERVSDSARIRIRRASSADAPFLRRMLHEAANWRGSTEDREVSISHPAIAKYVEGWGTRRGDLGVVAEDDAGSPVGAAWCRLFGDDGRGFGYVAADVPEITLAVEAGWRRRGVGRALLAELIDRAARGGVRALSLSVEEDNPALGLYSSCGFEKVGKVENAWTMVKRLQ